MVRLTTWQEEHALKQHQLIVQSSQPKEAQTLQYILVHGQVDHVAWEEHALKQHQLIVQS